MSSDMHRYLITAVELNLELNDTIRTHKHVTDFKLDSTVDRILLLWGPFISEESNCTSMIKQVHLFTDRIVNVKFHVRSKLTQNHE